MSAPEHDPDYDDPLDSSPHLGEGSEGSREGKHGFVGDFVKKFAVAGLGALFMTEEGIRNLAGQLKLPKEVLGYILAQAEKTKDDLGRVVSDELRRFLQSEKLRDEVLKLLSGTTVEVTAQIRLLPKSLPAKLQDAAEEVTSSAAETTQTLPAAAPLAETPAVTVTSVATRRKRPKKDTP